MSQETSGANDDAAGRGDPPSEREPSAWVVCPYCAETVQLLLDPGGAPAQEYIEDCEVCCRPWHILVRWDASGIAQVEARAEEE